MRNNFSSKVRAGLGSLLAIALVAYLVPATQALAGPDPALGAHVHRTVPGSRKTVTVQGQRYVPTIWVDPDGCQHWVMDDGAEGYMTPNVNRDGTPVCNRGNACMTLNTDQNFATDSYKINAEGVRRLTEFFRTAKASAFVVIGHTDSRASDAYNLKLGFNRAKAVAEVGAAAGARIADIRTFGERMPKATNATPEGRYQNRRVEIMCIR